MARQVAAKLSGFLFVFFVLGEPEWQWYGCGVCGFHDPRSLAGLFFIWLVFSKYGFCLSSDSQALVCLDKKVGSNNELLF